VAKQIPSIFCFPLYCRAMSIEQVLQSIDEQLQKLQQAKGFLNGA